MEETEFRPGSVPVCVAARVYGKDASWEPALSPAGYRLEKPHAMESWSQVSKR